MLLPIPEDVLRAQARERLLSMLIGSLGVSMAAVSAAFAAYMVARQPGSSQAVTPRVVVAEAGADGDTLPAFGSPPADRTGAGLDFTPTGSIPDGGAGSGDRGPTALAPGDFVVRDVFDDTAIIEAHGTLQMVRTGSVVAGVGEVLSIARRPNGWVVATTGGTMTQRR